MAFVVSQGQLSAVSIAPLAAPAAYVQLADGVYREYAHLYRVQPQIRTVVSFLARNIAQLGLHAFRRLSDTDRERLVDHPLPQILAAPGAKLTKYRLIERLVSDIAIYDTAYWVKVKVQGGGVIGVIPIPPSRMTIEGDNWLQPEKFTVHGSKGDLELRPDQVVHFHGYDPVDLRYGSSPIDALRSLLAEEFEANRAREQMWRNGGRLSGVLKRPADAPKWDPTARSRFKEGWRSYTSGGGTPILEDGMEYEQLAIDPAKAQYIEARKLTREEVAAAYHIPLPMVGILDHATFSNIKEQHQHLYQDTLGPWLTMIQEEVGLQLIPDLPDSENVYVEFNLQEKLRGSFEEQAAQLQTAVGAPWLLRNEARARMNLPSIDGGDDLITPLNVLVGEMASPTDTAPDPAEAQALPKAGGRLVLVKAGRPEGLDDADAERDRFVTELEALTRRHADVLLEEPPADADGVPGWWARERDVRVAQLQALIGRHMVRMAQLGAWDVLEEFNPRAQGWSAEVMDAWLSAAALHHAELHDGAGETAAMEAAAAPPPEEGGLGAALALAGAVWVGAALTRSETAATEAHSFGGHDAAGASGMGFKQWVTTSAHPRSQHAAMNGEKVPLDGVFSNGLRWPGDGMGDAAETANCRCLLTYSNSE
ncbi:phage portal protein [Streptomyces sp. AC555_RSS877]|uniref:phage portal protein n=1 Tax=Streptomyces sp. AC555_RSS877 TaxID=2823688 RepID=UPI001C27175C|nr:phage portal protein [Streptomyces sp. AC555_RSS877]